MDRLSRLAAGSSRRPSRWARQAGASHVVLAVPVAPKQSQPALQREADEVVTLDTPEPFYAVGQWYERFEQVSDDEVMSALSRDGP